MNGWLFWFKTQDFVDNAESVAARVNENIGGDALAKWLSKALGEAGFNASEPWPEDHGYDFSVASDGRSYLCSCHSEEEGAAKRDAAVSLTHMRSLKDRLFGSNKFVADDPLSATVFNLLAAHPGVTDLKREE